MKTKETKQNFLHYFYYSIVSLLIFLFCLVSLITSSHPDIVIYSVLKKTVILIELTSPCEENFEDRHFDKIARYEARPKTWQTTLGNLLRMDG